MSDFRPIPARALRPGTIVRQPMREALRRVSPGDPAVEVMTDLAKVPPVPVDPEVGLEAAMRIMVRRGVRSLFVLNVDDELVGLVTATDFLGEKPMKHIYANGGRRSDVRVADVMTPHAQLEVLALADVLRARVGDVLATLRACRRQHAMVVEDGPTHRQVVRGVFSASQLEAQLGTPVSPSRGVSTFAEIRAALA